MSTESYKTTQLISSVFAQDETDGARFPHTIIHRIEVDGIKVFYREAGPASAPVVLLLHGFPTLDAALLARPGNVVFQEMETAATCHLGKARSSISRPAAAQAFQRDNPNASVQLLDTAHFALETHFDEIAFARYGGPFIFTKS
jgi:hypothetical protein